MAEPLLGIAMAEVVLRRAQVDPGVGQVVATGVPQHVRPHPPELGLLANVFSIF